MSERTAPPPPPATMTAGEDRVTFFVAGRPQGKGRARAAMRAGGIRMFTPEKTREYEASIAWLAKAAMRGREPFGRGVAMRLVIQAAPPKSWPKRQRERALAGLVYATYKPDADNVIKAVGDAGNGVLWFDDSQIVRLHVDKVYDAEDGVQVTVTHLPVLE